MNLLIAFVTLAFGVLAITSPARAAEVWGAQQQLSKLAPRNRAIYLVFCRILGGLLILAGILVALDDLFHWE
jgi:uncharacterized protein (DUF3084 family)